jgi:16S rRNA (uracil1498-N3)-methyltransferase
MSADSSEARRFFLEVTPDQGAPRLLGDDEQHARRVLRMSAGDRLVGLDGRGSAWPLRVERVSRAELTLAPDGPPVLEVEPGAPQSDLPWIEIAASLPRGARAEEMLDRLVQLGVSAVQPLIAARTQGFARELSGARLERLQRVARESCKQSRRTWLPLLHEALTIEELVASRPAAATCLLAPEGPTRLLDWAASAPNGTRVLPLRLLVGPEGGFTAQEERFLADSGAERAHLGPHVLRIETAAEAAVAGAVQTLFRRRSLDHQVNRSRSET